MRLTDTTDAFERTYSYPVDRQTVVETMGDTTIEAPSGDGETIAETLDRAGVERFDSPTQLRDTLMCFLPEQYIGRKYYDDRGDNPGTMAPQRDRTDGTDRTTTGTETPPASD
jgi:hypothetical protein